MGSEQREERCLAERRNAELSCALHLRGPRAVPRDEVCRGACDRRRDRRTEGLYSLPGFGAGHRRKRAGEGEAHAIERAGAFCCGRRGDPQ